jgi:glutamate synthase (NADPH/NADH) small chain
MGKPTGFLEFGREPLHVRPPLERILDWSDAHPPYDEATLREQGARCMDCAVPFCHTGKMIGGMASGCPVNNLIPEWNDLVYRGQWREALVRLQKTNNFPEFTGRVCPAPCEGSCTVGISGSPVTIKTIELEIVERGWANGWIRPEPPLTRTGLRVAVVGSGPAGLACAAQLNRAGHDVTVFERADRIGGLLTYGIPNMKLDKRIVERRVGLMAAEGVHFMPGVEAGRDVPADGLLSGFDAVVIATGSTVPRDLRVEGRDLAGIHPAMDFLRANTKSLLDSGHRDGAYIPAAGRHVVVIGGGDTGTDCVATAIRHGARSVTQLEILDRPPDARAPDNPWPQWPKVYRLDYGQEEAAALWGADPRRYAVSTRRFVGDETGHVAAVETVEVEWAAGPDGRVAPRERPGTERQVRADLVLLALGFVGPERSLPEQLGCQLDARGTIATGPDRMTSVPGVFAAGDCSRGQSLVVWAIREGREAARAVDVFLMHGETVLPA